MSAIKSTKLVPPSGGLDVPRPRLGVALERGLAARLTAISAPAGFGKTTLLAQFWRSLETRGANVGWLSLERADGDAARFALYFVTAIRRTLASFGGETLILLSSGLPVPAGAVINSLLNELSALARDFYLALDDYHLIARSAAMELIRELLLAPLPRLHLLVATRSNDGLPLARLRVLGQLEEIGIETLKFSITETNDLLALSASLDLSPPDIAVLQARTEGWVAGLQLAAIALKAAPDRARFLRDFSGAHRNVGDFLADEVMKQQPEVVQDFLLRTSLLTRFNVDLCKVITGRADARDLLDEIERINLFLFSLDDRRGWYRYHHLFAGFLQARLHDVNPGLMTRLHKRAARWLADHDFIEDALDHAFSARDYAFAAEWLDRSSQSMFGRGQTGSLRIYTRKLPPQMAERLPRLQLVHAWDHMLSWRFESARVSLEAAREAIESAPQRDPELIAVLTHRETMVAMTEDDLFNCRSEAADWLERQPTSDGFMRASAGTALMHSRREFFQLNDVSQVAKSLREIFVDAGAEYGTVFHDSLASVALLQIGDLDTAEATLRRACKVAVGLHGADSPLAAMPSSLLAALLYERDQIAEARELVESYGPLVDQMGFVDTLAAARVTESRLAFAQGELLQAQRALDSADELAGRYAFERLRVFALDERVRQLALNNEMDAARHRCATFSSSRYQCRLVGPAQEPTVADERLVIAVSRVASSADLAEVDACLQAWLGHARQRGSLDSVLRLLLALAANRARRGAVHDAVAALVEALEIGESHGYVRTFVDAGATIMILLDKLPAARITPRVLRFSEQLQARFVRAVDRTTTGDRVKLTEELTVRELEILRLAGQSMINREIAEHLHLSETTVKWYWRRILQKMAVQRRQQAIRAARDHGLLPRV